jgi:anaerobic selenocysteine-containing dehydrogenase
MQPVLGISYPELQEMSVFQQKFEYRKYEKGLLRRDGEPGFNTPTGLVELKATLYPGWGEDALPYFEEPVYSPLSRPDEADEFPLILTAGGRRTTSFHSEHRQVPSLRAIMPDAMVEIHPETAAKYGIKEGDWVRIENQLGYAVEKAHLTPIVDPRVVHAAHGWWYPEQEAEEPNLFGVWKTSVNSMIPHRAIGKLGFGAPYKCVMCNITKVDSLEG